MRIGILTLPLSANNYGGILQNYALQKVLKNMGHTVQTIDYKIEISVFRKITSLFLHFILRFVFRQKIKIRVWLTDTEKKYISSNNYEFVNKNIDYVDIGSIRYISKYIKSFDVIITGSDQIWRKAYINSNYKYFFLYSVPSKIRKIVYGASIGNDGWTFSPKETLLIKNCLRQFVAVSVRETDSVPICKENIGFSPQVVLDPVLLLQESDYQLLMNNNSPKDYICAYILDSNEYKTELINSIIKMFDIPMDNPLPAYSFQNVGNYSIDDCVYPGVSIWLTSLFNAKYVVTDSYHGMILSIVFKKQFVVIANHKRGYSRFSSLLDKLGIKEHLVEEGLSYEEIATLLRNEINWEGINNVLSKEREESLVYLNNAIGVN